MTRPVEKLLSVYYRVSTERQRAALGLKGSNPDPLDLIE
jgi:hypothetical protein